MVMQNEVSVVAVAKMQSIARVTNLQQCVYQSTKQDCMFAAFSLNLSHILCPCTQPRG